MWHLEGTSNSLWGKKNSCFRYFKHKAYLGLSKNEGVRTGSKDAPLSNRCAEARFLLVRLCDLWPKAALHYGSFEGKKR